MISMTDEHEQTWIFTEQDLSQDALAAFKGLSIGKGQMRVWRSHVFSGFLNAPDPSKTLELFRETLQDTQATGMLSKEEHVLQKAGSLLEHSIQAHICATSLHKKMERILADGTKSTQQTTTDQEQDGLPDDDAN